jgi:mannan polymerase II complex MNN10 subunit
MPPFSDPLKQLAISRYATCTSHAPFPVQETRCVAFASANKGKPTEAYQRAMLSQMFQMPSARSEQRTCMAVPWTAVWNKIAFLLHLLMTELLKPEEERPEWIM